MTPPPTTRPARTGRLGDGSTTVRARPGRPSAIRTFRGEAVSYQFFDLARRALNRPKWRFPGRADAAEGDGRHPRHRRLTNERAGGERSLLEAHGVPRPASPPPGGRPTFVRRSAEAFGFGRPRLTYDSHCGVSR
jgi:hypothetical protein